jgi:hypothetical protein
MRLNRVIGAASRRICLPWISRASEKTRRPLALASTVLIVQYAVQTVFTFSSLITTVLSPLLVGPVIFGITFAALKANDGRVQPPSSPYEHLCRAPLRVAGSLHDQHRPGAVQSQSFRQCRRLAAGTTGG